MTRKLSGYPISLGERARHAAPGLARLCDCDHSRHAAKIKPDAGNALIEGSMHDAVF
jgi:hypothetical protein